MRHGSYRAIQSGNRWIGASGQKSAVGRAATLQAVTRVKPEQASKVKSWMPTRLLTGEGRANGEETDKHLPKRGLNNCSEAKYMPRDATEPRVRDRTRAFTNEQPAGSPLSNAAKAASNNARWPESMLEPLDSGAK